MVKRCQTPMVHHAYHDPDTGLVPCCGQPFLEIIRSGDAETTDPCRVTCRGPE